VGGWVHCRRPLARPRAQATKKPKRGFVGGQNCFQALVKRLKHKFF
jgi:hypothetical protein